MSRGPTGGEQAVRGTLGRISVSNDEHSEISKGIPW